MFLNNKTQVLGFESQNLGFIVPRGVGGVGLARNNETQVLDAKTWVSLFRGAWGGAGQHGTTKPRFWNPKPGLAGLRVMSTSAPVCNPVPLIPIELARVCCLSGLKC